MVYDESPIGFCGDNCDHFSFGGRSVFAQYGPVKQRDSFIQPIDSRHRPRGRHFVPLIAFASLALPARANASLFHGETLDSIANGISWVVLIVAPIIGISIFWLVHILPEKPVTKAGEA